MDPIVAIVGPTAVGKTELALVLAERLDGEIVSADALQAYRGFDIGTAKPSPEQQERVAHHLIDILEPTEPFSAGAFAERALEAVEAIRRRGRRPFVVGGSGLYLRALVDGIGPLPPSEPAVRQRLQERLESEGLNALWEELARHDPSTADRLPRGDRQRILRALEVFEVSGRPLSEWIRERPFGARVLPTIRVGLTVSRGLLYDRIAQRVGEMLQRGWVEEVSQLLATWEDPRLPAFQAIGYRQIARHLLEGQPLDEAIDETVSATRRFAKRQMTWFRKDGDIEWFSAETGPPVEAIERFVRQALAGRESPA